MAYQGGGRKISIKLINRFNNIVVRNTKPDITFLIDIDIDEVYRRMKRYDRIEREGREFHKDVRDMYLKLWKRSSGRIKFINGKFSREEIHKKIVKYVEVLLRKRGYI